MDRPFYSITINGKNTWDEWGLMPVKAGRIEFATPELRYDAVTVAGSDNVLDFTEALTGYPLYNPRKGSIKFRFFNNGRPVRARFQKLKNEIHGKLAEAIIDDQPEYYYYGRFMVGDVEYKSDTRWADVELSYILDAYKYSIDSTTEPWLWDPFDFENGVIRDYSSIEVSGTKAITVVGSRKPTSPKIILTAPMELTFEGQTFNLEEGRNIVPAIMLVDQEYIFYFRGTGQVTIDMEIGSL